MKKEIIFLIMISFFISSVYAINLGIMPSKMNFNGEVNQAICKNVTLFSSKLKLQVYGDDKWSAEQNAGTNIVTYVKDSEDMKIEINYTKKLIINNRETSVICITPKEKGFYKGVLIYRTNSTIAIGMWINVNATQDKTSQIAPLASLTGKAISLTSENLTSLKYILPLIASTLICIIILIVLVRINSRVNKV